MGTWGVGPFENDDAGEFANIRTAWTDPLCDMRELQLELPFEHGYTAVLPGLTVAHDFFTGRLAFTQSHRYIRRLAAKTRYLHAEVAACTRGLFGQVIVRNFHGYAILAGSY